MTPLEIAAKARWESYRKRSPLAPSWEGVHSKIGHDDQIEDMRAALLALAAMEWPSSVTQAGADAIVKLSRYGEVADETTATHVFHAMLRAIAESQS